MFPPQAALRCCAGSPWNSPCNPCVLPPAMPLCACRALPRTCMRRPHACAGPCHAAARTALHIHAHALELEADGRPETRGGGGGEGRSPESAPASEGVAFVFNVCVVLAGLLGRSPGACGASGGSAEYGQKQDAVQACCHTLREPSVSVPRISSASSWHHPAVSIVPAFPACQPALASLMLTPLSFLMPRCSCSKRPLMLLALGAPGQSLVAANADQACSLSTGRKLYLLSKLGCCSAVCLRAPYAKH